MFRAMLLFMFVFSQAQAKTEADYTREFCPSSRAETVLPDGTRPDCMIWGYVVEVDWARGKWYEAVGQSLHYAQVTGKSPAMVLLVKKPEDCEYVARAQAVARSNLPRIEVFVYGPAAESCSAEEIPGADKYLSGSIRF